MPASGRVLDRSDDRSLASLSEALRANAARLASVRRLGSVFAASDLSDVALAARFRALARLAEGDLTPAPGVPCSAALAADAVPTHALAALAREHADLARSVAEFDAALARATGADATDADRNAAATVATFLASVLETHLERVVAVLDAAERAASDSPGDHKISSE